MAAAPQAEALTLAALATTTGGSSDSDPVTQKLLAAGMTQEVATEKRRMLAGAATRLTEAGLAQTAAAKAFWTPGRVEIAGCHTDYAGGRSLLCATSRGFVVVSVDREDAVCRIFTTFRDKRRSSVTLEISKDLEPEQGHWSSYPAAVIRRLARNFDIDKGVDVAIECDLPESSGMSTSSAVVCYMWLILAERNNVQSTAKFMNNIRTDEDLYAYLGFVENGQDCGPVLVGDKGVGTFGGSEDHTAIMSSEPNKVKMFSYCPTKHEGTFDFPEDATFVIAVSGFLAQKTANAMTSYNNAAFLARDAAAAWCKSRGMLPLEGKTFVPNRANLAELVRHVRRELGEDSGNDEKVRQAIGDAIAKVDDGEQMGPDAEDASVRYERGALRERFEHFFDESEVTTRRIAQAIAAADYSALGKWSDESHSQKVDRLRNTVPETAWLPQEARRRGALGASSFGAGFGGSCWALVRKRGAETFADEWADAYRKKFPRWAETSTFFAMAPGPGAFRL